MIVDDLFYIREEIREILEKNGYEIVTEASNGKEAIDKAFLFEPDIITMDMNMPKINGIEASRKIKKRMPNVKIILVSTMAGFSNIKKIAKEVGINEFVSKPFDSLNLIEKIKKLN
ncbi:two-component system chemotaxis response regulator CheY [Hypnocyclicus thermotrophus]|uniref:Two-component system chemotaxis response regulator CheY n=2 Tax=Hypnocyclicus thermotrophus TaxID=1627895 RepID=A0AA46DZY8_9FUSO|nr:two-component system chemotaxis response regulator CheY [Hypnocyclicus thermotrophus]